MKITIDGKEYALVEIELKQGDILIDKEDGADIVVFKEYHTPNYHVFKSSFNIRMRSNFYWRTDRFRHATEAEKQQLFDALEKIGKRWNAEKICVEDIPEEPKGGDLCIFWDHDLHRYANICYYKEKCRTHCDISDTNWDNAIKWDGTIEQYEKVLRGEIKS